MFGSTLILGVSVVFLIQHLDVRPNDTTTGYINPDPRLAEAVYTAKWMVSSNISITIVCQTIIALLSRSLDHKGTLKIDNRYLRLFPRLLVIVVALCLPIGRRLGVVAYFGILASILVLCLMWEWTASLERGGGILEP